MIINERLAVVMLDCHMHSKADDPHHSSQYHKSVQAFAEISAKLCEEGKFKKLEQFLNVAWKLFRNGNETVRLSRVMDQMPAVKMNFEPFKPKELRLEYARTHHIGGL